MNTTIAYVDSQPSYSCPVYCDVEHEHFVLELDTKPEPVKQDSLYYLAYLEKEVVYEEE